MVDVEGVAVDAREMVGDFHQRSLPHVVQERFLQGELGRQVKGGLRRMNVTQHIAELRPDQLLQRMHPARIAHSMEEVSDLGRDAHLGWNQGDAGAPRINQLSRRPTRAAIRLLH